MTDRSIGVDISKAQLDVFDLEANRSARFANTARGLRDLRAWLGEAGVARVVFEPTGAFHRAFEGAFSGVLPLVKVNPLQARRFAEACGSRAKSDAIDARLLARMGQALDLEPDRPASKEVQSLKELQLARRALMTDRTRLRNRLQSQDHTLLKNQSRAQLAQIERQIGEIDAEIAAVTTADAELARKRQILCSIPGIGRGAAAAILALVPEIGGIGRKQLASLAGVAPHVRSSGEWTGKTFVQGGRKPLRDALYMPALVAARFNPDLKAKYTTLRDAGKPPKVAIIAILRKLLELANALIKADRIWRPIQA